MAQKKLENCNPAKFNKCDDMAELTHLNEPSVIYNLYLRYSDDLIYTYSGLFLVAINPYKRLPIYDTNDLKRYHEFATGNGNQKENARPPPHIFAIAESTFRNLLANKKNQSILVTGESGAGKTENTKKVIQYLSSISTDLSLKHTCEIHDKILQANPILESFGNAKTVKNNNSSRFGKFIKIFFDLSGLISGATIDYYLLEKLRVLHQSPLERNYHVFYQLLKGEDKEKLKNEFHLSANVSDYKYISASEDSISGVDDSKDFSLLMDAFHTMGFDSATTNSIFAVLAIILHLGNLDFSSWKSEQASFSKNTDISVVAGMLGVSSDELSASLLRPKVKAGREFVQKLRKAPEVKQSIDAFAKHLYEKLFQLILSRINDTLGADDLSGDGFIGVLDIAGFEIFDTNSFEQLCINYTNEKLQQFFNHHSFILEQSEYLCEDIQWEFIDFGLDLQPTIDLIELKQPMGILDILDDQCILPKASDETFISKLLDSWGNHESKKFKPNKVRSGFIVDHYAGPVEYNVKDWIQKNTDPVSENILQLFPNSKNVFIRNLLCGDGKSTNTTSNNKKTPKLKTVSQKHKEQLSFLMEQLESTEPHFVRCILPNLSKKPNRFDKRLVLHQLRCNGVLEGIRIARAGYPNKMSFEEFFERYSILYDNESVFTKNMKTNCEIILKHINLSAECYKIGITKLFFKNGILGKLEESRDLMLKNTMTKFQSDARAQIARRGFRRKLEMIQASQVVAKNISKLDDLVTKGNSPWLKLFVNLKPLLEDSVKVLDSKEMNESLKQINSKLKDTENARSNLEEENGRLKEQIKSLEDEIIKTNTIMSEKSDALKNLRSEESKRTTKLEDTTRQLSEIKANSEKLATEHAELKLKHLVIENKIQEADKEVSLLQEALHKEKTTVKGLELRIQEYEKDAQSHLEKIQNYEKDIQSHKVKIQQFEKNSQNQKVKETEFTELKAKKEALEKDLSSKITNLQKQLAEVEANHTSSQERHKEMESSKQGLEKKLAEMVAAAETEKKLQSSETNKQVQDLQEKLATANKRVEELQKELDAKNDEVHEHKSRGLGHERQLSKVQEQLNGLKKLEQEFENEKSTNEGLLRQIQEEKDKTAKEHKETARVNEELLRISGEYDNLKRTKASHQDEILRLRKQVQELETKLQDKENVPPATGKQNENVMEEFALVKLKLNELHAMIRKEKFENQKLSEEVSMLRKKVDSSFESPLKRSELRRSLAIGEDARLGQMNDSRYLEELKVLRIRLQQEEANVTRAENYAIELQKKVNKLQMSRGLNSVTDYEEKFKTSQRRISELEKQVGQAISGQASTTFSPGSSETSNKLLTPSNSFGSISSFTSSGDFAKIYKDITSTLRTTRDELGTSKKEILRLKSLLRESEDELYEAKRLGVKALIKDYEEKVARLEVQNDFLDKKQKDLEQAYKKYKTRSEEYYDKLELAESAVEISKRHEEQCRKELEEKTTELKLLRDETKAYERVIKDLRQERNKLEEEAKKSAQREEQLASQLKQSQDQLNYLNDNYGEKKHRIGEYKEEIRILRQDIKFKLEKQTELIRENENFKIENEELRKIKADVLSENDEVNKENEQLVEHNETLKGQIEHLSNDKQVLERKLEQSGKQVVALQGLLEENAQELKKLDEANGELEKRKKELEEEVFELKDEVRETSTSLELVREHNESLDSEKRQIKQELDTIRSQWDHSDDQYKLARKENLVMVQESESLKKVNEELKRKVEELEEKLYSNEQLRYLEGNVGQLSEKVDKLKQIVYEGELKEQKLLKQVKTLQLDNETKTVQMKKYNDENFNFHNMVGQYLSKVEFLLEENNEKDVQLKAKEREIADLRERLMMI